MSAMAKMRSALGKLEKVRTGEARGDEVNDAGDAGIFKEVSEEEYRGIVEARRDTFIVGGSDRGYDDSGKEIWEDPNIARQRRSEEAAAAAAAAAAKAAKQQAQAAAEAPAPAPGADAALRKAFGAGARATGTASSASAAPAGAEQKDLDDMLMQMCGQVEATTAAAPAGGAASAAAGAAAKRRKTAPAVTSETVAAAAAEPVVKTEPKVKIEPADVPMEDAPRAPITLAGAALSAEMQPPADAAEAPAAAPAAAAAQETSAPVVKDEPVRAQEEPVVVKKEPMDDDGTGFDESVLGMSLKRKREEAEAEKNGAAGMRSWLKMGSCPGVKVEPGSGAATDASAATAGEKQLQQALEADGALWFYLVDAVEEERSSRVHLFGKVRSPAGGHQSCCVVVEKIERCLHLLLNVEDPDDEAAVAAAAEAAEAELRSICQKQWPAFKLLRTKVKKRNYAFEKPMPHGDGELAFLKVFYEANAGQAPVDLSGQHFPHVFGTTTSALERLFLTRRIMGPGWLRLLPGTFAEVPAKLSTCALELRGTPATIHAPKTNAQKAELSELGMPSTSPALRVMSLSMQTVQRSAQHGHEPVCIVCTMHPHYSPEGTDTEQQLRAGMRPWAAVRRIDSRQLPRDAETLLPQGGVQICSSEAALLTALLNKVQEFDPDVLLGYSAYGFDLDVLASRMAANKIQVWQKLGRLRRKGERQPRSDGRQGGGGFWVGSHITAGRLVCDTVLQARDMLKLTSYDLPTLVREQLGCNDLEEIEPEALPRFYDSAKQLAELAERTFQQALAVTQLVHSLQILPLTKQLTNLAGNVWNSSLQSKRAERNEMLLCHEFHRQKFVLPDKETALTKKRRAQLESGVSMAAGLDDPDDAPAAGEGATAAVAPSGRRGKAAYTGGLVLEPKAGLYDDFVLMLDFNSLYPSIIQEHNICFSTVDRPNEKEVAAITSEADLLAKTKLPDGSEDEGVLPKVLRRLVQSRREVKAAMKTQKDAKKLQVLEIRQKALKLTANSLYGTLGFQNSRFYTKPLAAMITMKGREALQSTISIVQQELSLDVVYGDTDSIFVNSQTGDYDQAMQAAQQIKRSVNKRYKKLEIEIDGVFGRLLLLKKKKYAAVKVIDWKERIFEREVKGLDMVRRDWCPLAKELGEAVLKQVLESADGKEAAVHWIHDYLTAKRAEVDARKIPLHQFIITKAVTKAPKDYPDAKNQPHVQVALRLQERGRAVLAGQEIEYVICEQADGASSRASVAERAYHPHELTLNPNLKIDIEWYKEHQLHPVLSRMLSCVEGTDAGRIAECLGMDGSRFARKDAEESQNAARGAYVDMASADVTAALDRKTRFKGATTGLPGVTCPSCGKSNPWEALLRPDLGEAGFSKEAISQLFKCKECSADINPNVARNQMTLQFRKLLRSHSEGWSQGGDDDHLGARTRRRKCGLNEVSERKVMQELELVQHLCEAQETLAGSSDARGCREAAQGMGDLARRVLSSHGNNWIHTGELFGSIFGKR